MHRSSLKGLLPAVLCALLLLGPIGAAHAAGNPIVIRIGSDIDRGVVLSQAVYRLADLVAQRSKGRIKIEYFPNSALGNAEEQISGARSGTQEIWFGANPQMGRLVPAFQLFSPAFAYEDRDAMRAVLNSDFFADLRDQALKKVGMRMLSWDWFRGYRYLCTIRPVRTLEDLKGLKLRVPPAPAKLTSWKKLGASPTPTAAAEIFMALKQKVVEGVEIELQTIHKEHMDEVCKYLTLTAHDATFSSFTVNEAFWDTLSPADQKLIVDAIHEEGKWAATHFDAEEAQTRAAMETMGVQFIELSKAERARWYALGQENFLELEKTKKWWPDGTVEKIRAKDPHYYKPL
jgi:TRAP-type transport system periplasmic protein